MSESQNGEFTIGWDSPKTDIRITGYIVNINPPPSSGICAKGICSVDAVTNCSTTTCTFVIDHLDHNTEYHIALQSVNCAGRSVPTEPLVKPAKDDHSCKSQLCHEI